MEYFFNFSLFQWRFLALKFSANRSKAMKRELIVKYLLFSMHIINIVIYGTIRSFLRLSNNKSIADYISGFQAITFSIVMLIKYIGIFKNTEKISEIIKLLPQKFTTEETAKFGVKKLKTGIFVFYIYGLFIASFVVFYLSYMIYDVDYDLVGGIWTIPGSKCVKRIYFVWMIYLNLSVLIVWIYNEVVKYGLIVITIVELRKLNEKFAEFCNKLKTRQEKEELKKKKVSFNEDAKDKTGKNLLLL